MQSTFMYLDHQFCSEKCRDAQIRVDIKLEKVQDSLATSKCVQHLEPMKNSTDFSIAIVSSHDGTEFMQRIGMPSVLAKLKKGEERKDLVRKVLAGFVRWPKVQSPRSQVTTTRTERIHSATTLSMNTETSTPDDSSSGDETLRSPKHALIEGDLSISITSDMRLKDINSPLNQSEKDEESQDDCDVPVLPEMETHACLMCFKTSTALEILMCDEAVMVPRSLTQFEIAPALELRKQMTFKPRRNLKAQLRYDKQAAKYLDSQTCSLRTTASNSTNELQTCDVCTVM